MSERCPHCNKLRTDLWDYGWGVDEDEEVETDCGNCEMPILIKRSVRVTYEVTHTKGPVR